MNPEERTPDNRQSSAEPGTSADASRPPPLVLVVEDSRTQADWLRAVLGDAGYAVEVAPDGAQALRTINEVMPGIILSDVDMPYIDGFELCRRVKDDPRLRTIPFVMVTHRDRVTDLVRALEAGADNYVTKPLEADRVLARVGRIMEALETWRVRVRDRRQRLGMPTDEMVLSLERTQVVEMLMATAQKLEDELGAVTELGVALTMTHNLPQLLEILARRTLELSGAEGIGILLRSPHGAWTLGAVAGSEAAQREFGAWAGGALPFEVSTLSRREPSRLRRHDRSLPHVNGDRVGESELADVRVWPLVLEGDLIGILALGYREPKSLTGDEHRRFRHLADQAALAVVNARLFEEERALRRRLELALLGEKEAHKNAIFMLASAVEARDGLTGAHLRRVQAYSTAVATALGLDREFVEEIGYSSVLHDVGKLLVPDEILGKPGALTDEEWVEMRRHAEYGERLLAPREFFAMAREIANGHHEKWDGSGYPQGLAGEAIPLAARITSVADVFDALTTVRPYKAAWTGADALAEIGRLSGLSFDPAVVDAFLQLYADGRIDEIRRESGEDETPLPA